MTTNLPGGLTTEDVATITSYKPSEAEALAFEAELAAAGIVVDEQGQPVAEHAKAWTFESSLELALTIEKIDKINARATKRGLAGVWTYAVTERTVTRTDQVLLRPYTAVVSDLVVDGIAPRIAGWSFVATIEHDDEVGFTTRAVPGFEGLIDRGTLRAGWCDHCKSTRNRLKVYLLESVTGERVQVGSSCIKDFLGHDFSAAYLPEPRDLEDIERGFGGYAADRFDVADVLTIAIVATRLFGWVARSSYTGRPTSTRVQDVLRPGRLTDKEKADAQAIVDGVTPADVERVAVVRTWIAAQPATSEYITNLQSAARVETIPANLVGVLASGPAAYDRAMGQAVEREVAKVSEWIGTAGDKVKALTVTVTGIRYIEGQYGTMTLYTFKTSTGSLVKWFASASSQVEFAEGDVATINGTIKKTETYNEVKSTVLTRVKRA